LLASLFHDPPLTTRFEPSMEALFIVKLGGNMKFPIQSYLVLLCHFKKSPKGFNMNSPRCNRGW
jgi:hypothetical protein